jgi:hypothetical protein
MTHAITWDHTFCDHDEPDGGFAPRGYVTCDAPAGSCRKHCRTTGYDGCEDGWTLCGGECAGYDHADPGAEHCTNGHVLDRGECNVVLFLDEDPDGNGPATNPFTDGPIDVEWTGHGYVWEYSVVLDATPHDAVG